MLVVSRGVLGALLVVVSLLGAALPSAASGAWAPEAVFETTGTPEPGRIARYLGGEIGVFRRDYSLLHHWALQRALRGKPLSPAEIALARAAQLGLGSEDDGFGFWRQRRAAYAAATGGASPPELEVYGTFSVDDADNSFLNCQDDAFLTAAKRLETHLARSSDSARWVADWVAAQDAVFGNCAVVGGSDPPPVPPGAPLWLVQDRAYQQAAAWFYRGDSQRAAEAFAAVASDAHSPWCDTAAYLVPRTWMREALHFAPDPPARADALDRARQAVVAALAATADPQRQAGLGRLQRRIALSIDPVAAFAAAVERLDVGAPDDDFLQDLEEVRFLRDDVPSSVADRSWLLIVRREPSPEAFETALARLYDGGQTDWLLAALVHAPADDPRVTALLDAVAALPVDAPGKWTLDFERARLLLARGDASAEAVLARLAERSDLSVSDRNALVRLRFIATQSLVDALPLAAATPLGVVFESERDLWPTWQRPPEIDQRIPSAEKPRATTTANDSFDQIAWQDATWPVVKALRGQQLLHPEAAAVLGRWLPLTTLADIAITENSSVAAHVRGQLADVAWVRAWLLGRGDVLDRLTPRLAQRYPEQRALLEQGVAGLAPAQATVSAGTFRGALFLLRMPGLSPVLHGGVGRALPVEEIGQLALWRWWSAGVDEFGSEHAVIRPRWLTDSAAQEVDAERARLATLPDSTRVLAGVVLRHAAASMRDPLVPEALHYVVRATRYGVEDSASSRRAFERLHRVYPRSVWTARTPYHY